MTHITVKSRIPFKPYFKHILRENFFSPLPLIILFFTLLNLVLLVNYYARFFYFTLSFPAIQWMLVLVVLVLIPLYFYITNRIEYKNNPQLQEHKIFEFTEDDIRISNDTTTVLIEWQNLYKFEETRHFLILFYDYATAYFVLKSDFANPEQLNEVLDIVKSKPGLTQAFIK